MKEVYVVVRRDYFGVDFHDSVMSAHSTDESAKAEANELQERDNKFHISKCEYYICPTKFTQAETLIQKKLNLL